MKKSNKKSYPKLANGGSLDVDAFIAARNNAAKKVEAAINKIQDKHTRGAFITQFAKGGYLPMFADGGFDPYVEQQKSSTPTIANYGTAAVTAGTGIANASQVVNSPGASLRQKSESMDKTTVGVASAINPYVGMAIAGGEALGGSIRTGLEKTDSQGNLQNKGGAQAGAIIGSLFDPVKAITTRASYKGGWTDWTGKGYVDALENESKQAYAAAHPTQSATNLPGYNGTPLYGNGGPLDVVSINGPRHEGGGVPMMTSGGPIEAEGGETKQANYIYSDRLKDPKTGKTFADVSKVVEKRYKGREDKIATESKQRELDMLKATNDTVREAKEAKEIGNAYKTLMKFGGYLPKAALGFNGDEDNFPIKGVEGPQSEPNVNLADGATRNYYNSINLNDDRMPPDTQGNSFNPTPNMIGDNSKPLSMRRPMNFNRLGNQVGNYAEYAPAAYNMYQGMFGKTEKAPVYSNPYTKKIEELTNNRVNFDPIRNDIRNQGNAQEYGLRNSGVNRSEYLANRGQISAGTSNALSNAHMQEQQANAQFRIGQAGALQGLGTENTAYRMSADELNRRAKAIKEGRLSKGLDQVAGIAGDRRHAVDERQYASMVPNLFPEYKYYPNYYQQR